MTLKEFVIVETHSFQHKFLHTITHNLCTPPLENKKRFGRNIPDRYIYLSLNQKLYKITIVYHIIEHE